MPTWLKILLAVFVLWRVVRYFRPAKQAKKAVASQTTLTFVFSPEAATPE